MARTDHGLPGVYNASSITLANGEGVALALFDTMTFTTAVTGLTVGTTSRNTSDTTASNSITTLQNNSFVVDCFVIGTDGGVLSSTWSSTVGASARSGISGQIWYKSVPTAGAQTPSYAMTVGNDWSLISTEIEAAASADTVKFLYLL